MPTDEHIGRGAQLVVEPRGHHRHQWQQYPYRERLAACGRLRCPGLLFIFQQPQAGIIAQRIGALPGEFGLAQVIPLHVGALEIRVRATGTPPGHEVKQATE